jgi:phosphohistidine phosphatase SixA
MFPRPLTLLIIRHAEAEPATATSREADDVRALTDRGRRQAAVLAPALRALDLLPSIILTSPLVRARQTAAILRDEAGKSIPIEILDSLRPGKCTLERLTRPLQQAVEAVRGPQKLLEPESGKPARLPDSSAARDSHPILALVGHQPDLGGFILDLIAPENADVTRPHSPALGRDFSVRKGSIVVLTFRQGEPNDAPPLLETVLQPSHARLLGKLGIES